MSMISNGVTYSLIGAGLGGLIGIVKTYINNKSTDPASLNNIPLYLKKYKNILLDPLVVEITNRFQMYQNVIPVEFDTITSNLDKLIGLQVSINNNIIEPYFPYRATGYVTNIKQAVIEAKNKMKNISVPNWDEDQQTLLSIAEDYLYNNNQEVNAYMISKRN